MNPFSQRGRNPWMTGFRLGIAGLSNHLRSHPVRSLVQLIAIALGVTLGLAVHLIHASALDSFASGVRQFSGTADRIIRGPREGFGLDTLERALSHEELYAVSPVVELEIAIDGLPRPVKWLGLDFMRAAAVTPNLLGAPEAGDDLFDTHAVFLSPALASRLGLASGDTLIAQGPSGPVHWRVAGLVPQAAGDSLLAVSDIAASQWRFGIGDRIHRIDIKGQPGMSSRQLEAVLNGLLEDGQWLDNPDEAGSRGAAVSRAYRVNLTILALVALLTGGFLVYASQTLAAMERRRQWALLNALGADPAIIAGQILTEAGLSGLAGSLLGTLMGIGAAAGILQHLGADLGGGFFQGQRPDLHISLWDCLPFALLGIACSIAGAWQPARQAAATPGVAALKSGDSGERHTLTRWPLAGVTGLLACPLLAILPPVMGLPLGGYAAIAAGLAGGIACMPALLQWLTPAPRMPKQVSDLSRLRTRFSPGHSGIALAGIVASFSLVVAMAIMVNSFRESLISWLDHVLPAPLYLRVQAGDTVGLSPELQQTLRTLNGVQRAEFWMTQPVSLSPNRPAPTLIFRPIDPLAPQNRLPLVEPALTDIPAGQIPVWVSEAIASLYGWTAGSTRTLNLPGAGPVTVFVSGLWRDYARQQGAIVMDTGAASAAGVPLRLTDAAFWPTGGTSIGDLTTTLRDALASQPWANRVEFAETQFIRDLSLTIFDRSFAITYLLEAAAIGIGLLGIATTFAATALARRNEFAALSAMGADRQDVLRMLLTEGFQVASVGVATGLLLGCVFSLILIHVVNPQSFNWTMDVHLPWGLLAILSASLLSLASLTAAGAGWTVLRQHALDILKAEHA